MADPPSVFLIPGRGGESADLAAFRAATPGIGWVRLDLPDWPVLARADIRLPDIVARLAARVSARAKGPVRLAGYSMGGLVAAALAAELRDAGHAIGGLLLLDSTAGLPHLAAPPGLRAEWRDAGPAGLLARVIGQRLARTGLPARWPLAGTTLPERVRFHLAGGLHDRLVAAWRRRLEAGLLPDDCTLAGLPATLFRATDGPASRLRDLGWSRQGVALRVVAVAGDHQSMLRERGASSLAARIGPALG